MGEKGGGRETEIERGWETETIQERQAPEERPGEERQKEMQRQGDKRLRG